MESNISNNCGFYKDLDTNFRLACELSEREYSHEELLDMLQNGNVPQKQIAALMFDYVNNDYDAKALLSNLTGCDGKIREVVALKVNSLLSDSNVTRNIFAAFAADDFAKATIDINANICRLVVDSAVLLKGYDNFAHIYTNIIVKQINEALDELDRFVFRDKKYVINKQLFKLYWCLEALGDFYPFVNDDILKNIVEECAKQQEYTIREKTARLVANSGKFDDIKDLLINDENYYVRQILNHPSLF